jgi:hypothetical protein
MSTYRHSDRTRRILASMARVACPPEAEELDLIDDIVAHVELSMATLPPPFRAGLLAGLEAYEQAARLAHRGRPASKLAPDAARAHFESWRRSGFPVFREFIKGVGGLLCLAHYEMPAIKERLGYTPEAWIEKVRRHRLTTYSDAIERQRRALLTPDPLPGAPRAAARKEAG